MSPDFPDKPLSAEARERVEAATDRSYRLRRDRETAAEVRRVAHGRVTSALERLRQDTQKDVATAIHDTRKDLKKQRSLLRLVRSGLGETGYRRENDRYRDAARQLAGARDAEVKLATLAGLRDRYPREMPAADALQRTLEAERGRLAVEGAELDERIGQAAAAIAGGAAEIDAWPLDSDSFDLVREGLERAYRRGRRGLRGVRDDPTDIAVHQWRKRVKDLWYHLRLLRNAWPAGLTGASEEAHALADLLGEHHDLSLLVAAASAELPEEPDTETLTALARRRQAELLEQALVIGDRLYAEKPKRYTLRLERYWNA